MLEKAFYLCLLSSTFLPLAASGAEAARKIDINVVSYNLRVDVRSDPTPWAQRKLLIADVVRKMDPDVMGTQEGLYHQVKDIVAEVPDYDWIGLGREGGSKSEFMAIFYKKKRLEPMAFDHFWLSDTPEVIGSSTWGNKNKRMVTWVQFKDIKSGTRFYVVNTHFDHQIQPAREHSAELLRTRIAALDPSLPVILTGDFNCISNNPAYKTLTGGGFLADTWFKAAQRKGEGLGTFNGFKEIQKNNTRIDWILFRGDVSVDEAEIVTWNKNGVFPSDHCPMFTKLRIGSAQP